MTTELMRVSKFDQSGQTPPPSPVSLEGDTRRRISLVDTLLFEIYDRWYHKHRLDSSFESDTITETSTTSDAAGTGISCYPGHGGSSATPAFWSRRPDTYSTCSDVEARLVRRHNEATLRARSIGDLRALVKEQQHKIGVVSSRLVRQLKRRDHRLVRLQKHCDFVTAILQAASLKRREDTKLKFTVEPKPGEEAFHQWKDAMKAVARLPLGLPSEFRRKVWLALSNQHISSQKYDWDRIRRFTFNDRTNPDDDSLGLQIVKDLHRTGCDQFCSESDRAVLKRVLLAYARWNKRVGYCQGFNVLAALILEVTERNEEDALKVMIYLVDHVLPESYFAQNLQALSVDMAVFRDLLRSHLPQLATHLEELQKRAASSNVGMGGVNSGRRCYEPPLTNVFTMQWFLTLFATCLPPGTVLRVWDSVLLEGSEIMLRTALTIWEMLSDRIRKLESADHFYSIMSQLTVEMAEGRLVNQEQLLPRVYAMASFPFPGLAELREKYTYNITPFTLPTSVSASAAGTGGGTDTGEEDWEEEGGWSGGEGGAGSLNNNSNHQQQAGPGCFASFLGGGRSSSTRPHHTQRAPFQQQQQQRRHPQQQHRAAQQEVNATQSAASSNHASAGAPDISLVGPGAVSSTAPTQAGLPATCCQERMTTNLSALEAQYQRQRRRQKNAALVISVPRGTQTVSGGQGVARRASAGSQSHHHQSTSSVSGMVNHLLLTHPNSTSSSAVVTHNRKLQRQTSVNSGAATPRRAAGNSCSSGSSVHSSQAAEGRGVPQLAGQSPSKLAELSVPTCKSSTISSSRSSSPESGPTISPHRTKRYHKRCWASVPEGLSRSQSLTIRSEPPTPRRTLLELAGRQQQTPADTKGTPPAAEEEVLERTAFCQSVPDLVQLLANHHELCRTRPPEQLLPSPIQAPQYRPPSPSPTLSSMGSEPHSPVPNRPMPTAQMRPGPAQPFPRRGPLISQSRRSFGNQFGLYKAMTNSRAARSSLNACLQRTCMNQMIQQQHMRGNLATN